MEKTVEFEATEWLCTDHAYVGPPPCPKCKAEDDKAEADTRRRENLGKPTRDYPGAAQMMAYQRLK